MCATVGDSNIRTSCCIGWEYVSFACSLGCFLEFAGPMFAHCLGKKIYANDVSVFMPENVHMQSLHKYSMCVYFYLEQKHLDIAN